MICKNFFFFCFFFSNCSYGMQVYFGRSLNSLNPENAVVDIESGFELGAKRNLSKSKFIATNLSYFSFEEENTKLIIFKQESLAADFYGVNFFNKIKTQISSGLGIMINRASMDFVGNSHQVNQFSFRFPAVLSFEYFVTSKVSFSILGKAYIKSSKIISRARKFYDKIHYNMSFIIGLSF